MALSFHRSRERFPQGIFSQSVLRAICLVWNLSCHKFHSFLMQDPDMELNMISG